MSSIESQYKQEIDSMVWSFSRVNSYEQCPYGWKLHYLDHVPQENSAFAEWGSLCHSLFEDYAKGNLAEYELGDAYDERFVEYMHGEFPPSRGAPLYDKYYDRGKELFSSFDGFPDELEIIGAEIEVNLEIENKKFLGYIDLLVRDKKSGKLCVIDHKSKGRFNNEEEKQHYAIQLYLYSEYVFQHYGEYPEKLIFNMFRAGNVVEIHFDENKFIKAKRWFIDTIQKIYEDVDFWDKIAIEYDKKNKPLCTYKTDDFFCCYLCGSRKFCQRSGQMT